MTESRPDSQWRQFCDLDGMFATRRWARGYLLGLGGYWALFAVLIVALPRAHAPWLGMVIVALFVCLAVPIGLWYRWMWLHRRSREGFLIAYFAGLNLPSQIACAFRRADWDVRRGGPVLVLLLALDVILVVALAQS